MDFENIKLNNIIDIDEDGSVESFTQELEGLQEDTVNIRLQDLAPNYYNALEQKNIEEKKDALVVLMYAKEILGEDFCNEFLSADGSYINVPWDEMYNFISETLLVEQNEDLLKSTEIILTMDELEDLHGRLTANNTTDKKGKLVEFIEAQKKQNITLSEVVPSNFYTELSDKGYNKEDFKNLEKNTFNYLKKECPNINFDSLRNLSTGISIYLLKLVGSTDGQILGDKSNMQDLFENGFSSANGLRKLFESTGLITKLKVFFFVLKKYNNENTGNSNNPDFGRKNRVLNNPDDFLKFINSIETNSLDDDDGTIEYAEDAVYKQFNNPNNLETTSVQFEDDDKESLQDSLKDQFGVIAKNLPQVRQSILEQQSQSIQDDILSPTYVAPAAPVLVVPNNTNNAFGGVVNEMKGGFSEIRNQGRELVLQNSEKLLGFKDTFNQEIFGVNVWETIKKLLDAILKFLGWKGGWDQYENEIIGKNFPDILNYLNEVIDINNVKIKRESIFYKGFEESFADPTKEPKAFEITGNLSYSTCKVLNNLGDNKSTLNTQLDSLFDYRNFDKYFEDSKEKDEFYKKAFSVKENEVDGDKIQIGVVNLDEIDRIIKFNTEKLEGETDQQNADMPNNQDQAIQTQKKNDEIVTPFKLSDSNIDLSLATPTGRKIANTAILACQNKDKLGAKDCTDWVNKIFLQIIGKKAYNTPYIGTITTIQTSDTSTGFVGNKLDADTIAKIRPGHYIVVDRPPYKTGRTHGVISLGPVEDGVLTVASYPNKGNKPPEIVKYDFEGKGRGRNYIPIRVNMV